jgi:hypothetical protein
LPKRVCWLDRTTVLYLAVMPRTRDQRYYNVRYYAAHRDAELDRVKKRQAATLQWLRDVRRRPCADCGQSFPPYVMDFDHRDPRRKLFAITTGSAQLMTRENLITEIEKCDIVCANCHALRTLARLMERRRRCSPEEWAPGESPRIEKQRARWQANAAMLSELRDVPCADCGRRSPPCVMQFDHRDPATKAHEVTRILMRARSVIFAEVAKCDIVCTNCHRVRTYERRIAA